MKKFFYFLAAVIVAVTVTSCKSKEEKAAELIKQELSYELYDFQSYEPIRTVVTEAKDIPINNKDCLIQASTANERCATALKHVEDVKYALEMMNLWGPPTKCSSSYSNSKYYEYKDDYVSAMEIANIYIKNYNSIIDELDSLIKNTNPSETIGYNVEHSFRCRTKAGFWTIEHCKFLVDKDFENIIFMDEKGDAADLIESAQNGKAKIDTLNWKKYTK